MKKTNQPDWELTKKIEEILPKTQLDHWDYGVYCYVREKLLKLLRSTIQAEKEALMEEVLELCYNYFNDKFNLSWSHEQKVAAEKQFIADIGNLRFELGDKNE